MRKKGFLLFVVLVAALVWGWNHSKPDTFFSDLSLDVPLNFIVWHHSPFQLQEIRHQLVLKIPKADVKSIQQVFAAQKRFKDVSANLRRRYDNFRLANGSFFPERYPQRFQAGNFRAYDHARHSYECRFLFDHDEANFTYLYLDSISPID